MTSAPSLEGIKVGFDLDGVLYPFDPHVRAYVQKHYGENLPEPTHWYDWGPWSSGADLFELMGEVYNSDDGELGYLWGNTLMPPVEDGDRLLRTLRQWGAEVVFITHRGVLSHDQDHVAARTLSWLNHNYRWNLTGADLVLTDKTGGKAEVCDQLGLDFLIDDNPAEVGPTIDQSMTMALMPERAWNTKDLWQPKEGSENIDALAFPFRLSCLEILMTIATEGYERSL